VIDVIPFSGRSNQYSGKEIVHGKENSVNEEGKRHGHREAGPVSRGNQEASCANVS
jgi:hypothetical protein